MRLTKGGKALYMHCLPADITDVSCKAGEVAASVFDRLRDDTYREAELQALYHRRHDPSGQVQGPHAAALKSLVDRDSRCCAASKGAIADDLGRSEFSSARRLQCHDLDGFCSCYAETIELYNQGETEPYLRSKGALRELYGKKFANPALKVRIRNRIAQGAHVIDQEEVEGVGDKLLHVIVIYEVADDHIARAFFIR